jgi:hypothetical protein
VVRNEHPTRIVDGTLDLVRIGAAVDDPDRREPVRIVEAEQVLDAKAKPPIVRLMPSKVRQNVFEFIDTPYGFREAALRGMPDGSTYARIREVVLPYYSFIPGNHGDPRLVVIIVPIDDEWSAHWYYYLSPFGPVPEYYKKAAYAGTDPDDDDFAKDRGNEANAWHQDNEAMRAGHFSGILKNFVYEDFIVEESMGPVMDRSREFLGTSDAVIVRARRRLLKALEDHKQGILPFGVDQDIDYREVRALAIRFPKGTNWKSIDVRNPPDFDK